MPITTLANHLALKQTVTSVFTWKIKPAARTACTGTITVRLKDCILDSIISAHLSGNASYIKACRIFWENPMNRPTILKINNLFADIVQKYKTFRHEHEDTVY